MRIVICGGHLTPALSVVEALNKSDKIYYFGRKHALEGDSAVSLEYQTIVEKSIDFINIKTGRLQRRFTINTIPSLLKIPFGFTQALLELRKIKPNVVVGFGGYVSVPVCFAAKILGIPVVIHEQTLGIGIANKMLLKIADKICISFESSEKLFPKDKTVLTGNPIRKAILNPNKKFEKEIGQPVIFVTGGSLGSHVLNSLVQQSLVKLIDKYSIIHQAGAAEEFKDYEKLSELKENLSEANKQKYIVSKSFTPEEIGEIFNIASLVVCRAGINTISELIVLKKPALIIPLPVSSNNEQSNNANFIKSLGLGELIDQKNLTSEVFVDLIDKMMNKIDSYKLKEKSDYFPNDSASRIVKVIYATSKNNN